MSRFCKYFTGIILFFLGDFRAEAMHPDIYFTPNRGQWHSNIRYSLRMNHGSMYIEDQGITYLFVSGGAHHDHYHPADEMEYYSVKVRYNGSNAVSYFEEKDQTSFYHNYFLGNDPAKWKSRIFSSYQVTQRELYDGISIVYGGTENEELKYDYLVKPGGNPAEIEWEYQGAESMFIRNGDVYIKTPMGTIIEKKPVAWQMINDEKIPVDCEFILDDSVIRFGFPQGYDQQYELIIDPVLIFSSFSGSTANNFGFTATYDSDKNTYGGGIAYSSGYPVTAGAYQPAYQTTPNANQVDMAISKFSTAGNTLVYSTYLGGTGTEAPHSLVVNDNDELYILGTTSSPDFPMTNSFDPGFNGGSSLLLSSNGMDYIVGSDIVIVKLSTNGSVLLGSTYMGGTGNDGVNTDLSLHYNYGDVFRGEIIIDNSGNCVVASVTSSSDFPVAGSIQNSYGGGATDGVVFKLSPGLNALLWSTYFGGSGGDAVYGLQLGASDNIYFTGGTTSAALPVTSGVVGPAYSGLADGFLAALTPNGTTLLACTYLGTSSYDQSYFVQVDTADAVYVFGQTTGSYPIMPAGVYNNGQSGQFIHKLNNTFTTTHFSTRIGRGNAGNIDISPCAFLVNNCGLIYLSGWGGGTNNSAQPDFSSTTGLPVTPDAHQSTTDGSDFYLMILSPDAGSLIYGTFMGGTTGEHVDGGTSRFDKSGVVYQAVCAGCWNSSSFPTTPGAWSNTNGSSCNLAVFKFDLQTPGDATMNYTSLGCDQELTVNFSIDASSQVSCFWDFGDGTTSTSNQPTHTYTTPDTYIVSLVTVDMNNCYLTDTLYMTVEYPGPLSITTGSSDTLCPGDTTMLSVNGGNFFTWSPAASVVNPGSQNPLVFPTVSTTYTVIATDSVGCADTSTVYVHVPPDAVAGFEINYDPCQFPTSVSFSNESDNAVQYYWDFGNGFTSVNENEQSVFTNPGIYQVTLVAIDSSTCNISDTLVQDVVIFPEPEITVSDADTICNGESAMLSVSGAVGYSWTPSASLNDPALSNPVASPASSTTYMVIGLDSNGCADTATVYIHVQQYVDTDFEIIYDPCLLPNPVSFLNNTANGVDYYWDFGNGFTSVNPDEQITYTAPGTYEVTLVAVDSSSCNISDTSVQSVFIPVLPDVTISDIDSACAGENVIITASGGSTYYWWPDYQMGDQNSASTVVNPLVTTEYFVMGTDTNGCSDTASITVNVFPTLIIDAGPDFINEVWDAPSLITVIPDEGTYYWAPPAGLSCTDCPNPVATPEFNTWYYLFFTDLNGCEYVDSMQVIVAPSVFIPNAFTPDADDDLNDVFYPVTRNLSFYEFYIFNRWGELIFYSDEMMEGWDGTFNGRDCPVDVYVWKIKYADYITPTEVKEKIGHVTLVR